MRPCTCPNHMLIITRRPLPFTAPRQLHTKRRPLDLIRRILLVEHGRLLGEDVEVGGLEGGKLPRRCLLVGRRLLWRLVLYGP